MGGVISQIRAWAAELKYWEQAALERIASGIELTEKDYQDLMDTCLQDGGLVPIPSSRPHLSFASKPQSGQSIQGYRLERLLNLKNVNALPEDQELRFGPQLTIIFGDNGAGKTGYARPLGSAAFARGEREVLPNATKTDSKSLPQADIEISKGEGKKIVHWKGGSRCPELAGFYVFDAESLSPHLAHSNRVSFSPAGLSLLTMLADVTEETR